MDTIELVARNGDAVRQAIHMDTASEELTDEFLLFAINSGLLKTWADAFPDPRQEAAIGMEVLLAASSSARFAGLYSFRKLGYVLQSARVLGVWSAIIVSPTLCSGFSFFVNTTALVTPHWTSPLEVATIWIETMMT
jgi:hypothetical protein